MTTEIGTRLHAAREKYGLSLRAVSKLSGVASGYISDLETGSQRNPTLGTLLRLCSVYRTTVSAITRGLK